MVYDTDEFRSRVELLLSSTHQYIFLSSSRVYVDSKSLITESTPRLLDACDDKRYLATDEYALKKAREEDILFQSAHNNYTIVRPYITYGENRLPLGVWEKETWTRRLLEKKDLVLPYKFLEKYTTLAYGKDVSSCISKLVGKKISLGRIYNIVGSNAHRWSEILSYYLDQIEAMTDYRPHIVLVGKYCTDVDSIMRRWIKDLLHLRFFSTRYMMPWYNYQLIYDREFNRRFDNTRLQQAFPDVKFSDYEENLGNCLREFATCPTYNYRAWEWEAFQDRLIKRRYSIFKITGLKNKIIYIFIRYITPLRYIVEN